MNARLAVQLFLFARVVIILSTIAKVIVIIIQSSAQLVPMD
jgi:hypothetical protein